MERLDKISDLPEIRMIRNNSKWEFTNSMSMSQGNIDIWYYVYTNVITGREIAFPEIAVKFL